jgi:hypothetical protein
MRQVRARNERVQQGDLAGAVGDAQALADAVDEAAGRVERARATLAAAIGSPAGTLAAGAAIATIAISTIAHRERYLRRLRHDLDATRGELLRAEARHRGQLDVVDVARGRLALARAERELIERHFAAWRAERRKLAERRED